MNKQLPTSLELPCFKWWRSWRCIHDDIYNWYDISHRNNCNHNTIQRLQRSVHLGVGAASSSTSAIGNSVCPLGAFHIKWKTIYTTITTETINNTAPTARIIKYGFQEAACSLPK